MAVGKCPSCEKTVTRLKIEPVEAKAGVGGVTWNAISYLCPSCNAVLGAGIDPIALKADTVNEIKRALGKTR